MSRKEPSPDRGGSHRMRDFTTGSIPRHILAFSLPMFVGNLLQALYNTVDSFWVGRFLGPEALGAVSVSFPIIFALVSLVMGLTMASTTMVAQYRGAGEHRLVRKTVANSHLVIAIVGAVSTVVGLLLTDEILRLMQTPEEIFEPAAVYLNVFLIGLVPSFLYNVASSILRGLGDSQTGLKYLAYATVFNIIADPFFLFGIGPIPPMGIRGVAIATVLAQVLSAVLIIRYLAKQTDLLSFDPEFWRIDRHLCRQMFRMGVPAGLQSVVVSLGMIVMTSIINTFGPATVAAFGVASRMDQFAFMPAQSISLAVSALVGQNLGASRHDRVREIVRWSMQLAFGITAVVTVIAFLQPTLLIRIFTTDAAVLNDGVGYLRIVGLSYVPLALMFTLGGVMRGAGDTTAAMVISFATLWGIRLPLAYFLSYRLGWGVNGAWASITISAVLSLLLHYAYYATGRWKSKVIVSHPPQPAPQG